MSSIGDTTAAVPDPKHSWTLPASSPPGIVAYTATRWGHLLDPEKMPAGESPPPARDCYRFALSHPAVSLALCGPANREQMQEALRALDAGPLDADEQARLRRIGEHVYGKYKPQFAEKGDEASGADRAA